MLTGKSYIPQGVVKKIIVMLHGYGANGDDLFDMGKMIADTFPQTAVYSPNAPYPFELSEMGYQWFGLPDLSRHTLETGIHKALPILSTYLCDLAKKHALKMEDLILIGFSQGCMMALSSLYHHNFGAVIGLSGVWVNAQLSKGVTAKTPVLLCHGTFDMIVPYTSMEFSKLMLERDGFHVETVSRPGLAHGIDPQTIYAIESFLENILDPQPLKNIRKNHEKK